MTKPTFAELHCHSYFSLLDGASAPEALIEEAQRLGEGRGHYVLTARTTVDLGMQKAATEAMSHRHELSVQSLQELHTLLRAELN